MFGRNTLLVLAIYCLVGCVQCAEFDEQGWTLVQKRVDGSTNFYRNWQQYKDGFGSLEKEFWLGLDRIHLLTAAKPNELMFVLQDFDGNTTYAKYDQFEVGNASSKYAVTKISGYSGTAGDSFGGVLGNKFSTLDSDNDTWINNCAVHFSGAWWYSNCHSSNLNGKYLQGLSKEYGTGMVWYTFRGHYYSLKSVKMMIRPKIAY